MAEVKNSFLSSKMNKDLDDRLIPNSEYRDALNIEVGKSETNNIGVLQNVYGNSEVLNSLGLPTETNIGLEPIGIFMDNQNNRIYQFLTDYTDVNAKEINLPPDNKEMKITVYDLSSGSYTTLVEGTFLNFSKTNLVIGVNLVEGLLFWTDNRNQPRKINYNRAINNPVYYTTETQISVAKYAPIDPISLIRTASATVVGGSGKVYVLENISGAITVGMTLVSSSLPGSEYAYVMSIDNNTNIITLYQDTSSIVAGNILTFLTSTMTDQSEDPAWPGDPAYLEDKYVRFSYRFKFDDNEYSLMAPFSQIAYIPRQKGYFINEDETAAYRSTIVKWMENYINNIELLIYLPDKGDNINDTYKITNVEVLYKESDSLVVKVIDSISWVTIKNSIPDTNVYAYSYQSQKPYKTLNENQTTRVYDIVPTRALSQEISGNRVIYGNFYNTYTPPANINYNTAVQPKSNMFTNFVEYPNHTLKQNRNYQVGFVLADKFGRQSSVLLSSADLAVADPNSNVVFGGSTVYAPYQSETTPFPEIRNWFGNALLVLVNDPISSQRNILQGTPGLYAESASANGFAIITSSIYEVVTLGVTQYFYKFLLNTSIAGNTNPAKGEYLRGAFTDYVKVLEIDPSGVADEWIVETEERVNDLYLPLVPTPPVDTKFAYTLNQIGWYSYKIVVKQQQQDYYNAYLPGMLDGYPSGQTFGSQVVYTAGIPKLEASINTTTFPIGESGKTSHIVLINDNINKIPRDLSEVGPDQKQYRSSVQLFGRVENAAVTRKLLGDRPLNNQYATTITYTIAAAENLLALKEIKPGDGIQCDEANGQIPNPAYLLDPNAPPTIDNPQKWYANTVVVSNELLNYTSSVVSAVGGSTSILIPPSHPVITGGDTISYTTVLGVEYENVVDSISGDTITTTLPIEPIGGIPNGTILYFINPSKGVITFTPPNWTRFQSDVLPSPGAYINFTITKAENIQYYPSRKADVVSSIATSTDFNFLETTVDNVKGSAGLNFYQLQTRPLIGRVSTTKSIGVNSNSMIPFLSVYETAPEVTSLALFYETTSTGLISDLNSDVLVGFDGPTQFGDLSFRFFEDQDYSGSDPDYGDSNSRYITSSWTILNNTGFPIILDSIPTFSLVEDNQFPKTNVTNKFEIVEYPLGSSTYRFAIKENFVFDYNAPEDSKFFFYVKVSVGGIDYTLPYTNRLGNIEPLFDYNYPVYNRVVDQSAIDVVTVTGKNGSSKTSENQKDLRWTIISGNNNLPPYFQINSQGKITLIDSSIPLGTYRLRVKLEDAFNASPPQALIGPSPYNSKSTEVDVDITIGPKPVNDYLQYYNTGPFVNGIGDEAIGCTTFPGQGYGAVYVGPNNYSLDPITHINSGLPNLMNTSYNGVPYSGTGAYQSYVNVQIENGAVFGVDNPTGLTQGSLQFTISAKGYGKQDERRVSHTNFILYFKEPTAPNNTWQSILDSNGIGSPNSTIIPFQDGVGDNLGIEIIYEQKFANRSTSLVISNPTGVLVGEYCLVVYQTYFSLVDPKIDPPPPMLCGNDFYTEVIVQDANYNYIAPSPVPIAATYKYNVQLKEFSSDYPGAVPYNTLDALPGFPFKTSAQTTSTVLAGNNQIVLTVNNPQIVPGLWTNIIGQVTDVGLDGVTIIGSQALVSNLPGGSTVDFFTRDWPSPIPNGYQGEVYAITNNPVLVRQFYTDVTLSNLWEPPVPNKFYLFYNALRDYNQSVVTINGMGVPTDFPICSAQFTALGKVISQTLPTNTIKTAWRVTGQALTNYGRNLYQATS